MRDLPTAPADACCPPQQHVMAEARAQQLAATAKVLSDPVRLRIYEHIAASTCSSVCACHLPEAFGVSQPTLSHHLKKLTEAGLVTKEMRGRWAHFTAVPGALDDLRRLLAALP